MIITDLRPAQLQSAMIRFATLFGLLALSLTAANAQAVLRADIKVNGPLVTLGDLFDNAEIYADKAVFRAPTIGQSGTIRAERVIRAARNAGLRNVDQNNIGTVRVARASQLVTEEDIIANLTQTLRNRGYLSHEGRVDVELNTTLPDQHASMQSLQPFALRNLRFDRNSGRFFAMLSIGGRQDLQPIRLAGLARETIMVPVLTRSMSRGEIVGANDIALTPIAKRQANASKPGNIDNLIGKEARQSIRAGTIASASYFVEPNIVQRSDVLTILFRTGNLMLTMRGKALMPGAKGDMITVQNLQTNRIIRGEILQAGVIRVGGTPTTIASLGGN